MKTIAKEVMVDLISALKTSIVDSFAPRAGWGLALRSMVERDESGAPVSLKYAGGGGEDFNLDVAVFIETPMSDEAATEFLKSQKGVKVWNPKGEIVKLNGLQAAAWQIVKHKAESHRGKLRQEANTTEITPEIAQATLLGLRSEDVVTFTTSEVEESGTTVESLEALFRKTGKRVVVVEG